MHDASSFCYLAAIIAGCVGYWRGQLVGPAVAFIALGLLLIGR